MAEGIVLMGRGTEQALERPVSPRAPLLFALIVFLAALSLRLWDLSDRPMHNDEAVNHFFIQRIDELSYYPYSHENYHGPLYFYLLWFFAKIFGDTENSLRGFSALLGAIISVIPMCYRSLIGTRGAWIAGVLLALSPSLLYFSRYAIHETLFVLLQLWFAFELIVVLERRNFKRAIILGLIAGLLVSTKETFCIALGCMGLAAVVVYPRCFRDLLVSGVRFWALGLVVGSFVTAAIYTAGFRWFEGLSELVSAIPQWVGRGTASDTGHFKSFSYYFEQLMATTEPVIWCGLLLGFIQIALLFFRRKQQITFCGNDRLVGFFFLWTLTSLLIYSLVPYKTPWLIPNISLPAIVLAASAVGVSVIPLFLLVACFAVSTISTLRYNYSRLPWFVPGFVVASIGKPVPFGEGNPYSYVNSAPDVRRLALRIEQYLLRHSDSRLLVACSGYWPLPYYLRAYKDRLSYSEEFEPGLEESYQLILSGPERPVIDPRYISTRFTISEVRECVLAERAADMD